MGVRMVEGSLAVNSVTDVESINVRIVVKTEGKSFIPRDMMGNLCYCLR